MSVTIVCGYGMMLDKDDYPCRHSWIEHECNVDEEGCCEETLYCEKHERAYTWRAGGHEYHGTTEDYCDYGDDQHTCPDYAEKDAGSTN